MKFACGAAYNDFLVMIWFSFEFIVIFMLNLMLYSSSLGEIAHWIGKKSGNNNTAVISMVRGANMCVTFDGYIIHSSFILKSL